MNFNNLNWHDAIIKNIIIDRSSPGLMDVLEILVIWRDETESSLIFKNVYWVNINMNMGIKTSESILSANVTSNNEEISNLYLNWKGLIDNVKLKCYTLKTNSTNSDLKIIASSFEIKE